MPGFNFITTLRDLLEVCRLVEELSNVYRRLRSLLPGPLQAEAGVPDTIALRAPADEVILEWEGRVYA